MKEWKQLTFEQRKVIASGIAQEKKVKEIGVSLQMDPTSISKEVKRNRIEITKGLSNVCKKANRWPYVCTGCYKRYDKHKCSYTKYKYDAKVAQRMANERLIGSRIGIDLNVDEFKKINDLIKEGVDNKKSIYQIKIENGDTIKKSISTLYSYIILSSLFFLYFNI